MAQSQLEKPGDSGLTSAFRVLTGRIGFGPLVLPCHPKPLDSPDCPFWLWRFRQGGRVKSGAKITRIWREFHEIPQKSRKSRAIPLRFAMSLSPTTARL